MEEKREELELTPETASENTQETENAGYMPRPKWQVTAARIGLVVFIILLALYYGIMFMGGGR